MAPRYFLERDFGAADGLVSYSPHWALAFARFANPITYDPSKHASIGGGASAAYAERDPHNPLIVDDTGDCVSLSVSADKDSHTSSMQATLLDSGVKYTNEILPGDWVVAFMVYSQNELKALTRDLKARVEVNTWDSGLKFVGRVSSIQKSVTVSPDGTRRSVYSLSCVAFGELDSTVMYYPQLAFDDKGSIATSMYRFSPLIGSMVKGDESDEFGALDPNTLIPKLMTSLFGVGVWAGNSDIGPKLSPNQAYIVPSTICKWFGVTTDEGKFSDLMRVLIGVQKYSTAANATNLTKGNRPGKLFWPDEVTTRDSAYASSFPVSGTFPATEIPPTTTSAWSFISNYVASPVNEATVGLRPDEEGNIYPFLTVRQTPYTSEVGKAFNLEDFQVEQESVRERNADQTKSGPNSMPPTDFPQYIERSNVWGRLPTTRFLELPRWVVPDALLTESTIGRSDSLRQNLVYVYGTGPGVAIDEYQQFVNSPPIVDELDVMRNGIRPYMPSVNCFLVQALMIPLDWRELMADIVMGQHLTLSGSLSTYGIRSPIAPGDNIEFQDVIYHIQSVSHACSIDPGGMRNWNTRFSLARGMVDGSARLNLSERSDRTNSFPNLNSTDPDGVPVGVSKD